MKKLIQNIFRYFGIAIIKYSTFERLKGTPAVFSDVSQAPGREPEAGAETVNTDPELTKTVMVNGVECPYWLAPKTYNPCHPNYDVRLAKNYPGTFYTVEKPTKYTARSWTNPFFQKCFLAKIQAMSEGKAPDYDFLIPGIRARSEEMCKGADYANFREKYRYLNEFIDRMNNNYPGEYHSGAICEEDGQFLYYCVREVKPRVIVQTGTSNGVSCAHLAMGLASESPDGRFAAVDMPNIYRPEDPAFHEQRVYGVLIPQGKTSGWLIPDQHLHQFECMSGDARELLPKILEKVGKVDVFYHDSDHSYDHMWWEFETVFPYMNPHGIMIADNIAWSGVMWDWAQKNGLYSLNHGGSQGVVFV